MQCAICSLSLVRLQPTSRAYSIGFFFPLFSFRSCEESWLLLLIFVVLFLVTFPFVSWQ
jgi:hypothetical protein